MSGIIGGIKGSMKKKFVASVGDGDPYWSNVTLLLNNNGSYGSTTFTDLSNSPKTVTAYGNAQVNTSVVKYGSGSAYFDGTGDYLRTTGTSVTSLIDSAADYTVEGWVYVTGSPPTGYGNVFVLNGDATGQTGISVWFTGNTIQFWNNGYTNQWGTSGTISLNTWYHFAYVKSGSTLTGYINGSSVSTTTSVTTNGSSNCICIGAGVNGLSWNGDYAYLGYIDEFRITKGVARYTANFTPPTAAFPTSAGGVDANASMVSLLLTGDDLLDHSPSPKTVNVYGNTTVSTTTKKYGTGSIYFDGSGDYMTVASNTALQMNASDFTIECWAYISSFTGTIFELGQYTDGILLRPWGSDDFYVNGSNYGNITQYLTANTWTHFAVVKSGTTVTLYINGTSKITATGVGNVSVNQYGISIGTSAHMGNNSQFLPGYLDDFRITKGVARYTANFTPPTSALPTANVSYHPQWGNRYVNTSDTFNISTTYTTSGSNYIVTDAYGVQWKIFANFANTTPTRWGGVKYKNVTTTANTGVISQTNGAYATSTMATNVTAGNIYTDCVSPNSQGGANRCSWHTDSASDAYPNVTTAVKSAISAGNATFYDSMTASSSTNFCASMYFEPPADTTEVLLNFGSYYSGSMPNSVFVVNKATGALVGNPIVFSNQSGSAPTDLNGTTSRNVVYRHTPGYVYFVMEMNYTIVFSQFILIR
jgi:hypothetical protein